MPSTVLSTLCQIFNCLYSRQPPHAVVSIVASLYRRGKLGLRDGKLLFLGHPASEWSRREPHLSWSGSPEPLLLTTRLSCQPQQPLVRLDQREEGPETAQAARGPWAWVRRRGDESAPQVWMRVGQDRPRDADQTPQPAASRVCREPLIHSLDVKYILSIYCVPGMVLATGNIPVKKET